MGERIFISYKRADKELVYPIISEIERDLGIKCWIDMNGIESRTQFVSIICDAIDFAEVVLFMHSKTHLSIDYENDWTIKELVYARNLGKKVVLVKLDDSPLRNIFLFEYGSKNNIDSRNHEQLQKLKTDLRQWLGLTESISTQVGTGLNDNKMMCLPVSNTIDKHGYIDNYGNEVIPLIYDDADWFVDGIALVKLNDKYGYIDKNGERIVPLYFDCANRFSNGYAIVKRCGKLGVIDNTGKNIIPNIYNDI